METTFTPETKVSFESIFSDDYKQPEKTKKIITKDLLEMFYEHCENSASIVGKPKFWALKSYLKEYRTISLNCGKNAGHTQAGLAFTSKAHKPLFVCFNETNKQIAESINIHKGDIITASQVDAYIRNNRDIDMFIIDDASQYPSLDLLYDAFLYAGVGADTFILFLK